MKLGAIKIIKEVIIQGTVVITWARIKRITCSSDCSPEKLTLAGKAKKAESGAIPEPFFISPSRVDITLASGGFSMTSISILGITGVYQIFPTFSMHLSFWPQSRIYCHIFHILASKLYPDTSCSLKLDI